MGGEADFGSDWVCKTALIVLSAACWTTLVLEANGLSPFPLCVGGGFKAAFTANLAPYALAHAALMLGAMMAPLALAPLRHLRARSLARRRARASGLFLAAYGLVWSVAGLAVFLLAEGMRTAGGVLFAELSLLALAALWQSSPAKQWMLNRCHSRRALTAFGVRADLDAAVFGVQQGAACAGACWALMASALVVDRGALAAMASASVLLFAERLDRPGPLLWRVRPSAKIFRAMLRPLSPSAGGHARSLSGLGGFARHVVGKSTRLSLAARDPSHSAT